MEQEAKKEPDFPLSAALNPRLVLVGHPNVGKSKIFTMLTGEYVIVSNYPGTTVEVRCGKTAELDCCVLDTRASRASFPAAKRNADAPDTPDAGHRGVLQIATPRTSAGRCCSRWP